jgi:hypothetical protein
MVLSLLALINKGLCALFWNRTIITFWVIWMVAWASTKSRRICIQHIAHDVAVTGRAEELQSQQRTDSRPGRDHPGTGEPRFLQKWIPRDSGEQGHKQEKAPELGMEGPRGQVQLVDIGDRSGGVLKIVEI